MARGHLGIARRRLEQYVAYSHILFLQGIAAAGAGQARHTRRETLGPQQTRHYCQQRAYQSQCSPSATSAYHQDTGQLLLYAQCQTQLNSTVTHREFY